MALACSLILVAAARSAEPAAFLVSSCQPRKSHHRKWNYIQDDTVTFFHGSFLYFIFISDFGSFVCSLYQ